MTYTFNGWENTFWYTLNLSKSIIFCLLLLFSCKPSSSEPAEEQESRISDEFLSFYDRYHADSAFQWEHTLFPLPYLGQKREITVWTSENWVMHQPIDIENSKIFERSFYRMGKTIIGEEITSPSLNLKIERRWKKTQNQWMLIYYDPLD